MKIRYREFDSITVLPAWQIPVREINREKRKKSQVRNKHILVSNIDWIILKLFHGGTKTLHTLKYDILLLLLLLYYHYRISDNKGNLICDILHRSNNLLVEEAVLSYVSRLYFIILVTLVVLSVIFLKITDNNL